MIDRLIDARKTPHQYANKGAYPENEMKKDREIQNVCKANEKDTYA